ncbi:hypothetical protein FA09DRAFT_335994 [Tilletiopsis washingtonensis]|uniref:GH16 domain-containing protein n=1 Tax=Tilletiopsis washingtonensis TaxID=58919 RepID=A0A316ZK49_9BASI|nr:hypothetical protein FA09DRAFT_335994 [Tilletiopsis washingtonensis]PWO01383.1 hypothetical protein FA09DRAFT_335994 [Tilletiopsis washingtonensis]
MRTSAWTAAAALLALAAPPGVAAGNWTLRDDIYGNGFFNAFTWWDYADPTHGYVNYVSKSEARSSNLSYVASNGAFVMRADSSSIPQFKESGRKSVRLHSVNTMGDGVLVAKIARMPMGCGTWPAFWTCTRRNWPSGGEIDIIEGANDQGPLNLASLHTTAGCSIAAGNTSRSSGFADKTDCISQPGCSERFSLTNSFGKDFNQNGGGWYAMKRDTRSGGEGISVYFWPSNTSVDALPAAVAAAAGSAPPYVLTGANATAEDLAKWGQPAAHFDNGASCDMSQYFEQHEIIINLSFCGDWAGETFQSSGCGPQSCSSFVRNNPSAFEDARWEFDYVRVYTDSAWRKAGAGLGWTAAGAVLLAGLALAL